MFEFADIKTFKIFGKTDKLNLLDQVYSKQFNKRLWLYLYKDFPVKLYNNFFLILSKILITNYRIF